MKRKTMLILMLVFALCIGAVAFVILRNRTTQTGSFDLGDYQTQIEQFASDRNVGTITDTGDFLKKKD